MEATIQSNNKAINIDINVSINVGALKANIQRGLQATWTAIKQRCNVGTLVSSARFQVPVKRLYRKELKVARAIAKAMDARSVLVNGMMTATVVWFVYYVYMYY